MEAQKLETVITINAKTGNGFSEVGSTLMELGSIVNGLSQELISFGAESIDVYREYEKSMKAAEVALSTTYGRNTKELAGVMSLLDESATEWAATTIFHTNDVANAISEAAHAGWDYDQIISGLPASMQLAQAGGLGLSEAVNYIVKATSAAGIGFEDLSNFTDLWTFAANSSASTIGEFGDAMLRMGSTMRFAANPEELMTLIAVTANAGATGESAGTLIRNSLLRLIAPTKKAKDAMAELGTTSAEAAGLLDDEALAAANARLEAVGFSAFDEKGNLKSILDTYTDLYVALGEVAGGYENIEENQDALEILSAIFPTRTITEALTLLRGAADEFGGLYEDMMGGKAEGYGDYAAETMLNTLDGRIEIFESKVERLKQVVGEKLSGQAGDILGALGNFVDSVATMDDVKLNALISGLEVIAAAGPALLTAGPALRLIGAALSPAGGIALGAVALGAAAAYISELNKADFADTFGSAELESAQLHAYLEQLSSDFDTAHAEVDGFRSALEENVSSYKAASSAFSSSLLTDMLTNAELSESDIQKLQGLADEMHQAVLDGIKNSTSASESYWKMFMGGEESARENEYFADITSLLETSGAEAVATAESIGNDLRSAMTAAFADGHISGEEYQNILGYVQSYNEAVAQAQKDVESHERRVEIQKMLNKAQGASLSAIRETEKGFKEKRAELLEKEEDEFQTEYAELQSQYNDAIESGAEINGSLATAERRDAALSYLASEHKKQMLQYGREYSDAIYKLYDSQVRQGTLGDTYKDLEAYAGSILSGAMSGNEAVWKYYRSTDGSTRKMLQEVLTHEIDAYGGYEGIAESIKMAEESGDAAYAAQLKTLYAMDQINSNYQKSWLVDYGSGPLGVVQKYLADLLTGGYGDLMSSQARADLSGETYQWQREHFEGAVGLQPQKEDRQAADYEDELQRPRIAARTETAAPQETKVTVDADTAPMQESIDRELGAEEHKITVTPEASESGLVSFGEKTSGSIEAFLGKGTYSIPVIPDVDEAALPSLDPVPLPIQPYIDGDDPVASLQGQGVEVDVGGNTESLTATIDAEDGKNLLEYVSGDATELEMSITDQDGKTLVEYVHGNASHLKSAIDQYDGKTITVNIRGNRLFAEGGRATSASIFGEAGPEWAIPEEHTQRTAELLNAARAASGFTWQELLARYAGLNSNTGSAPATIIYSPTINAQDARGVEQVLIEDKERLDRWFREKQMMDRIEVYT